MIQKEPNMTVLSLQVALFAETRIVKNVPASNFYPAPKVDSAVIHMKIHNEIPTKEALTMLKIAKKAFQNRRKKLSNTLPEYKEELKELKLEDQRPQHLSITDWKKLMELCC